MGAGRFVDAGQSERPVLLREEIACGENRGAPMTPQSAAEEVQHVFIIGCKGIPARYGGFETFVDQLVALRSTERIKYHVACLHAPESSGPSRREFEHNGARCFVIKDMPIGPARAVLYDVAALEYALRYVAANSIKRPVFYVLACRIGPFIGHFARRICRTGGTLLVNPDGHEFMRAKWSPAVRRYWRYSEKLMVKRADLVVCDSKQIEAYIRDEYEEYDPDTTFIAYGADTEKSQIADHDPRLVDWYAAHGLRDQGYYLVVGRFVPENNYESIIREFMSSATSRDLVIITNPDNERFYRDLRRRTGLERDARVKFVGTVYDAQLLRKIRENAYAYLHGHEVGGTNPSLLEALASTDVNLLLGVGFNREPAGDCALYWSKETGDLAELIRLVDGMDLRERQALGRAARERIAREYSWGSICGRYEALFSKQGPPTRRQSAGQPIVRGQA